MKLFIILVVVINTGLVIAATLHALLKTKLETPAPKTGKLIEFKK